MMRANPGMMPAIAPLWAQTLDVPHADKLAQVLTAVAPEPVKAILQPQQQETTATLKAQVDQLRQGLQEAIQHAQDAQQEATQAQAELQAMKADAEAKEKELRIKSYDAETKRIQAMGATITPDQVVALVQQTIAAAMAQPQPLPPDDGMPLMQQPPELMQQPPEPDPMMQMHEQAEMPPAQSE
jgi:hypothetical protein